MRIVCKRYLGLSYKENTFQQGSSYVWKMTLQSSPGVDLEPSHTRDRHCGSFSSSKTLMLKSAGTQLFQKKSLKKQGLMEDRNRVECFQGGANWLIISS